MRTGLYARVAERGPTHGSDDMHMILIGTSGVRVGQGQKYRRTHCPTHGIWGLLTVTSHIRQRFLGVILWMLRIGEARHPEPRLPLCGNFSIECVNVGAWLSNCDLAMDTSASFLTVVEHRLIPARALYLLK